MHVITEGGVRVEVTADSQMGTNSYLVSQLASSDAVIIDANLEPRAMLALVREREVHVRAILLTHTDFDHVAGLPVIRQALGGPPVAVAEAELEGLRQSRPLRGELGHLTVREPEAQPLPAHTSYSAGSLTFTILPTPGHSPGGITLVLGRLLFTGDALFQHSIGRFDFQNSDGRALLRGIREQLLTRQDADVVLPGHGPASTIGEERRRNPFLQPGALEFP